MTKHRTLFFLLLCAILIVWLVSTEISQPFEENVTKDSTAQQQSAESANEISEINRSPLEQANSNLLGREVIELKVVSQLGHPIEGAWVEVKSHEGSPLTGAASDKNGLVQLKSFEGAWSRLFVTATGYKSSTLGFLPTSGEVVLKPYAVGLKVVVVDRATGYPLQDCTVQIAAFREGGAGLSGMQTIDTGLSEVTDLDGEANFPGNPAFDSYGIRLEAHAEGYVTTMFERFPFLSREDIELKLSPYMARGLNFIDQVGEPLIGKRTWHPVERKIVESRTDETGRLSPKLMPENGINYDGSSFLNWVTIEYAPGRFFTWSQEPLLSLPNETIALQVERLVEEVAFKLDGEAAPGYWVTIVSADSAIGAVRVVNGWGGPMVRWVGFNSKTGACKAPVRLGGENIYALLKGPKGQILEVQALKKDQRQCNFQISNLTSLTLKGQLIDGSSLEIKPLRRGQNGRVVGLTSIAKEGEHIILPEGGYEISVSLGLSSFVSESFQLQSGQPMLLEIPVIEWRTGHSQGSISGPLGGAFIYSQQKEWSSRAYCGSDGGFVLPIMGDASEIHASFAYDNIGGGNQWLGPFYGKTVVWAASAPSLNLTVEECFLRIYPKNGADNSMTSALVLIGENGIEAKVPKSRISVLSKEGIVCPISAVGINFQIEGERVAELFESPLLGGIRYSFDYDPFGARNNF